MFHTLGWAPAVRSFTYPCTSFSLCSLLLSWSLRYQIVFCYSSRMNTRTYIHTQIHSLVLTYTQSLSHSHTHNLSQSLSHTYTHSSLFFFKGWYFGHQNPRRLLWWSTTREESEELSSFSAHFSIPLDRERKYSVFPMLDCIPSSTSPCKQTHIYIHTYMHTYIHTYIHVVGSQS